MAEYKIDLHVHSKETSPCGMVSAEKLVTMYKDAGYHMLVMTDHYYEGFFIRYKKLCWKKRVDTYLTGYELARKKGEEIGLRVLMGLEISFINDNNDYLIFGMNEDMLSEIPELYKYGIKKFHEMVKNEGIMIFQAHPFRKNQKPAAVEYLDGMEVYNGNPRHNSRNHKAFHFAEKNNLKMISGSDFHQEEDLARGGIVVPEEIYDMEELINILERGKYQLIAEGDFT